MTVRVVRLGSPRLPNEGLRIGTVRRPPRGVPKTEYATRDYYDVWLPILAPSPELVKEGHHAQDEREVEKFLQHYRREVARPDTAHLLDVLAALSHTADFSVGCYCPEEWRCHRAVLRQLLTERGARIE